LYKKGVDGIIRCCVPEHDQHDIIRDCHASPYVGHLARQQDISSFYWPTSFKDYVEIVMVCDKCQRVGNIGRKNEMPMNYSLPLKPFDVWGLTLWDHFHHQITNN
jgi:hypothetical protein